MGPLGCRVPRLQVPGLWGSWAAGSLGCESLGCGSQGCGIPGLGLGLLTQSPSSCVSLEFSSVLATTCSQLFSFQVTT